MSIPQGQGVDQMTVYKPWFTLACTGETYKSHIPWGFPCHLCLATTAGQPGAMGKERSS